MDLTGKKIKQYELKRLIARGRSGEVYEAIQEGLNRKVAIKIIHQPSTTKGVFIKRFEREARALAAINHPRIVQIYDFGQEREILYIVMDLIEGQSLTDYTRRKIPPIEEGIRIILQTAEALEAAHQKGIIHRDIKPANILLNKDNEVYITDFGLAKVTEDETLTTPGEIFGTPSYMSPEQTSLTRFNQITARSDIFTLGVVFYELLTGRKAFSSENVMNTLQKIATKDPTPCRELNIEIDPKLEHILLKCLAKDPEERYPSAKAFMNDLHRFQSGSAPLAKKVKSTKPAWRPTRKQVLLTILIPCLIFGTSWLTYLQLKPSPPAHTTTFFLDTQTGADLIQNAKDAAYKKDWAKVHSHTKEVIHRYEHLARLQQAKLNKIPLLEEAPNYSELNEVGSAYLLDAAAYRAEGKNQEAIIKIMRAVHFYPYSYIADGNNHYRSVLKECRALLGSLSDSAKIGPLSGHLVYKAWLALEKKAYIDALIYTDRVIETFLDNAIKQQQSLSVLPPQKIAKRFWALNDVGLSYFLTAKIMKEWGEKDLAIYCAILVMEKLPYSQGWAPQEGWYWQVADACWDIIEELGTQIDYLELTPQEFTTKANIAIYTQDYYSSYIYSYKCVQRFHERALKQQDHMTELPEGDDILKYEMLNHIGLASLMKAKVLEELGLHELAIQTYRRTIRHYPFAQGWDPNGWYYSISDACEVHLAEYGIVV